MKAMLAGAALAAVFVTPSLADFYIVQEPTTKRCTIVEQRPASGGVIIGDRGFGVRVEAESHMRTVEGLDGRRQHFPRKRIGIYRQRSTTKRAHARLGVADKKMPRRRPGQGPLSERTLLLLILVALSALLIAALVFALLRLPIALAALTGLLVQLAGVFVGALVRVLPALAAALLVVVRICHRKVPLDFGVYPYDNRFLTVCVPAGVI